MDILAQKSKKLKNNIFAGTDFFKLKKS